MLDPKSEAVRSHGKEWEREKQWRMPPGAAQHKGAIARTMVPIRLRRAKPLARPHRTRPAHGMLACTTTVFSMPFRHAYHQL